MPINSEAITILKQINKEFGQGTVCLASDITIPARFTSGSLSLDIALGGGWPVNHWVELIGLESHGKTMAVLKTIAANQLINPDFTTVWIAAEHFDTDQALALGVDLDRVIVVPTQEMEKAFTTMLRYAESRTVDCIVLDSYPALIANEEAEKEMDEMVMALGARLTGKFFRKAGTATHRNMDGSERPMLGIIINQWREKIGGFSPRGTPKTTPGGLAKNFAFYVRLEVKRDEFIIEKRPRRGDVKVGQSIKFTTIKNKSAAPQQTAQVDFYFRKAPRLGFDRGEYDTLKEVITYGVLYGIITRRGKWYYFGGHQWNGSAEMLDTFRTMPELVDDIKRDVMSIVENKRIDDLDDEPTASEVDEG